MTRCPLGPRQLTRSLEGLPTYLEDSTLYHKGNARSPWGRVYDSTVNRLFRLPSTKRDRFVEEVANPGHEVQAHLAQGCFDAEAT